jgi:RNA polymerase sigma-70 factor (ECF subfamily)
MEETGDGDLVRRTLAGDGKAYGLLVARHQEPLYRLCYGLAGNPCDADELAHDAFVEAYLKLRQLREPDRFAAWLRTLALNLGRMRLRERRRGAALAAECASLAAVEHDGRARSAVPSVCLRQGLLSLSAAQRLVLALYYGEGLSYEEIARFLDVPIGTVMSRLHRARRELKQGMETMHEEETPVSPGEMFQEEVEAEIGVLRTLFRRDPAAMARLRVVLERSPERLIALLREAEEDSALDDLALLLRRMGRAAFGVVLSCYLSAERPLHERAAALLRRAIAGQTARGPRPSARIARPEAYLLLDELMEGATPGETRAALLLDLLTAGPDEPTALLLVSALLCDPDSALPLLLSRFWRAESPAALYREADVLHALCRAGTRFAAALLEPLAEGDPRRRTLSLAGAEALGRSMQHEWLDSPTDEHLALEARFRRKWAPPLLRDRDPAVMAALAGRVAALLTEGPAQLRESALQTLGYLQARDHRDAIAACATDPVPGTRRAALRALAALGDPTAAPLLMAAAREGASDERCLAIWALGQLRAPEAAPLLSELMWDADADVRRIALMTLGEISDDAGRDALRALLQTQEKNFWRDGGRAIRAAGARAKPATTEVSTIPRAADRVREGGSPPFFVELAAAIRALPALQSYDEPAISRHIARACYDFASTRRYLVEEGLLTRQASVYRLTLLGESAWRVERFIREWYLR